MEDLNLFTFGQDFPNDEACLKYLENMRWPNGVVCPHCGSLKGPYRYTTRQLFRCSDKGCGKQFSSKMGTIFTETHVPLTKWFLAIYLLTVRKEGTSSVQLAKDLRISQKSAWYMLQRIRYAMESKTLDRRMDGLTLGDETVVGSKHET